MQEQVLAPTRSKISLRGSTALVTEFFDYGLNSILFQRGIYPSEDFKIVKKYNLNMLTTTDERVQAYIKKFLHQVQRWLLDGKISRLVLVIMSSETREVLERWAFDIEIEGATSGGKKQEEPSYHQTVEMPRIKSEKEIHAEIQAIIRQITASVTFLPALDEPCTFNILAYTSRDADAPADWAESDPLFIASDAEQVRLRNFSTTVHRVEACVSYRLHDDGLV